jgi:hypothetical protein
MIKLKNGLPDFPESWDEVSFGTALKLLAGPTKSESIRIILGIEAGQQVEGLENLYRAARFLEKQVFLDPEPKKLGDYNLPQDITLKSTEQFEDISKEIKSVMESDNLPRQTEALAFYAAVYIQPYWFNNKYDSEQARLLAKTLHSYPCPEVMSAGAFFQVKYLSSESGLPMSYLRRKLPLKNQKPALVRFLRRLAFMER